MEGMGGDRFLEVRQKDKRREVFSKEIFLAVLLVVSAYILLYGEVFYWVGLAGFGGAILIAVIASLKGK